VFGKNKSTEYKTNLLATRTRIPAMSGCELERPSAYAIEAREKKSVPVACEE
jgi:hypothetical protein